MRGTRRLIIVLVAGLTFSMLGAAVIKRQEKFVESPLLAVAIPTTTTTIAPPTTAAPAAAQPVVRRVRPVTPPKQDYAPEPIVEIGTIEIPKIGLLHRIMEGITLRNIDQGPSHWPGTAMPGENGNTVFAGHRVTHSHPFLRINEIAPGDQIIFRINGVKSVYTMTSSEIVYPDALRIVDQTAEPTGTLFACHPPRSARQRYVVHMKLESTGPE